MRRLAACLLLPALLLTGCLERRLQITSEPPGALVWVNDMELGRTPLEADFTFYGNYDVRVRLDGYEPIQQRMTADQPLYEYPPFDLVAMAIPADFENVVKWHFDLKPALEKAEPTADFEKALIERAHATRDQLTEPATAEPAAKPSTEPPATPPK